MEEKDSWSDDKILKLLKLKDTHLDLSYLEISKHMLKSVSACQTMIHNIKCKSDNLSRKIMNHKLKDSEKEELFTRLKIEAGIEIKKEVKKSVWNVELKLKTTYPMTALEVENNVIKELKDHFYGGEVKAK